MKRLQILFYMLGILAFGLWIASQTGYPVLAGAITKPNTFVAGTTALASEVNDNFDTIYSEFNGNIESVNILDGTLLNVDVNPSAAIAISKLNTMNADFDSSGNLKNNVIDTENVMDSAITFAEVDSTVMPAGTILAYSGATAPSGWLLCYGQAVSRTTYAKLFAVCSTYYGTGDGSTTFNVPDLRGRVLAGQDDMGGVSANRLTDQPGGVDGDAGPGGTVDTGGAETHTLTVAQMPAHTHTIASSGTEIVSAGGVTVSDEVDANSGSTGGDGAHNNVQPTIIVNYIICTGGV